MKKTKLSVVPVKLKPLLVESPQQSKLKNFLVRFSPAFFVTLLPILITKDHWIRVWNGGLPRAWDGTGHYAIAQIYTNEIFPDTSGWINNYFAGMPFPNFYPPLFYWLIALLSKSSVFSFLTSFKIIVCLPILLIPLAFWILTWKISQRNCTLATLSSLICVWLLVDYRFVSAAFPLGLDYFSTFQIGLYTQPLGFILLLAWLFVYQDKELNLRKIGIASILLALVILANFFGAITACVFILAPFIDDLSAFVFRKISLTQFRQQTLRRLSIPILAVCISAFWLVPMLSQSKYFVTRPTSVSLFPSQTIWIFYGLALLGCIIWLKTREARKSFVFAYICLGLFTFFVSPIVPSWFPFQTNRFLANFNFLSCLPVGFFLNFTLAKVGQLSLSKMSFINLNRIKFAGLIATVGFSFLFIESPKYELSFYSDKEFGKIKPIFDFAKNNTKGRYLVENPDPNYPMAQLDGRAINSFLGMQGNETANIVFREASPSSLFFNPLISVFSAYPESYGMSSILSDDIDFKEQPIEKHLEQAKFLGIKYFVIISPWIKEKLAKANLKEHKFAAWSIFEFEQEFFSYSQNLVYKPALVMSDFSLKARKSDNFSFLRLAEEQFNDSWFDVLLVKDPQNSKIDNLTDMENFGAIIIEKFDYDNETKAFDVLKSYSQKNLLILFNSDDNLLKRIKASVAEFVNLKIIDFPTEKESHWLENEYPSTQYNGSLTRSVWKQIKENIENYKVATDKKMIQIKQTFHPNWQTSAKVFVSTPFFTVSYDSINDFSFKKTWSETTFFWLSVTFGFICVLFVLWKE
jgi:hypothetical protein